MEFRKLNWLVICCLGLLVVNVLKAEPRIGVISGYAQKYLANKGVEFGELSQDDLLDIKNIE